MAETILRVLAWVFVVGAIIDIITAPYVVGKVRSEGTKEEAVAKILVNAGLLWVLWDYLR